MDAEYWSAVRSLRLRIADLLESLAAQEWDAPSLCREWRVRDVAGHVAVVPTITPWRMLSVAPRARLNPNRINTLVAVQEGSRRPEEIVTLLRQHAGDQRTAKMLDPRNSLWDIIVHSQDIAIPLSRDFPVPVAATHRGLQRVWEMGWPINARKRLGGFALRATDSDWRAGTGPEVNGPALALLLLLTGRTAAAVPDLRGPGVDALKVSP